MIFRMGEISNFCRVHEGRFQPWVDLVVGNNTWGISLRLDDLYFWSNYSDLTRPHPNWWFSKGNFLISGKSRLVKYYSIWPDTFTSQSFVWVGNLLDSETWHSHTMTPYDCICSIETRRVKMEKGVWSGCPDNELFILSGILPKPQLTLFGTCFEFSTSRKGKNHGYTVFLVFGVNLVTHSSGFDWWRRSIGAIQSDHPCHAGPQKVVETRTVTSYL